LNVSRRDSKRLWAGRRLELVLGGGGALGAFQPGVYEALHEAGLEPDRLVGSSIGALNGALIAGNPRERRLERLRAFWDVVAEPGPSPAAWTGDTRRAIKAASALWARLLGRPGLYRPHLPRFFLQDSAWGNPSLYQLGPALATLRRLVDFERIGNGGPRLAANLTDLETGASMVIDSAAVRLRPEHLLASMGLLPDFPPTEIDGRWFCDGGFSANLPSHPVLDPPPETDVVCIAVDLLGEPGPPVFSVDGMMERSNDLLFANQTRSALATFEGALRGATRRRLRSPSADLLQRGGRAALAEDLGLRAGLDRGAVAGGLRGVRSRTRPAPGHPAAGAGAAPGRPVRGPERLAWLKLSLALQDTRGTRLLPQR
jgi:NTE family protein